MNLTRLALKLRPLKVLLGQRRRIVIMTAPVPPGTVPPKRAML
jgi:hypothetical protein